MTTLYKKKIEVSVTGCEISAAISRFPSRLSSKRIRIPTVNKHTRLFETGLWSKILTPITLPRIQQTPRNWKMLIQKCQLKSAVSQVTCPNMEQEVEWVRPQKNLRRGHPTRAVTSSQWLSGTWRVDEILCGMLGNITGAYQTVMCSSMHVRTWKTLKINKQTCYDIKHVSKIIYRLAGAKRGAR